MTAKTRNRLFVLFILILPAAFFVFFLIYNHVHPIAPTPLPSQTGTNLIDAP